MMSVYPSSYRDGECAFMVEGVKYELKVESFSEYQKINTMLGVAFQHGKDFVGNSIENKLNFAVREVIRIQCTHK